MGFWNHRVIRHVCKAYAAEPGTLEIVEMHYSERPVAAFDIGKLDVEGPRGHGPTSLHGDTIDGLKETVARLQRCLDTPVLNCMCDAEGDRSETRRSNE